MYFMMRKHDFPGTNIVEHHIAVGDVQPIRRPPYRTHFALRDEMQSQIQTLDKGVIRKSFSLVCTSHSCPEKSADGKPKYIFCVDFRALNSVTKFDSYPLPNFEETVSYLHSSK